MANRRPNMNHHRRLPALERRAHGPDHAGGGLAPATSPFVARDSSSGRGFGRWRVPRRLGLWLAGLLAIRVALPGLLLAAPGSDSTIKLLSFSGKVDISRRDGVWDPAHTNQLLYAGDRLRTDHHSRAVVRLSDGTTMSVGAEASLSVPNGRARVSLNPLRGLFFFLHRDRAADFELRNQTTVAAVRGTEFHLEVGADGTWALSVLDGEVLLQSASGELALGSGQAGLVPPGERPQRAVMRPASDLIQWCLYYPAVLDPDELALTAAEESRLGESLGAYRAGEVAAALACVPTPNDPTSSAEAIYRAALLLGCGQVEQSERLRRGLSLSGEDAAREGSLNRALTELIAVVKAQPRTRTASARPASASEWLAESYRLQAEGRLAEALAAAREAVGRSRRFAFGWARVAELEFCFRHLAAAGDALAQAQSLAPRNVQAKSLEGFLLAAAGRTVVSRRCFDEAIALDGSSPDGWFGRGLCRIRQGEMEAGRQDLLVAVSLEPQRAVVHSYLGKALAASWITGRAHQEFELAKLLDPRDPTAWLYSSLLLAQENRINEAIAGLEESVGLNTNRSLFRSRLLLDEDRAVRGANLARVYQDAGLEEVATRTATKAVESDYASYSAHLFLADSYNALRDPGQVSLRYETPWLTEYLVGNLLAPAQAAILSPLVGQQEYGQLFERNRLGLTSWTEYSSSGDWVQSAVQHGEADKSAYALEETYRSQNGTRANNEQEQLTLSLRLKQEVSPQDSFFFQMVYYDAEAGDLAPYYNPAWADPSLHVIERQEPLALLGYHHEWAPGVHTLVLAGRLDDTLAQTDANAGTLYLESRSGRLAYATQALYDQNYRSHQEIYTAELQQIVEAGEHSLVLGGRYQAGELNTQNLLTNGRTYPRGTPIDAQHPLDQSVETGLQRATAYGYEHWRILPSLLLVGGLAYDWERYPADFRFAPISNQEETKDQIGPKAGVVWTPVRDTVFRFAYTRSLGGVSFDQSFRLEPSQVAGFNQAFRSIMPEGVVGSVNAPNFETFGLQWEQQLPSRTYLGVTAEMLRSQGSRDLGAEGFFVGSGPSQGYLPTTVRQTLDYEERSLRVTLNQLLGRRLSVGASYGLSRALLDISYPGIPATTSLGQGFSLHTRPEATLQQVRLYALLNDSSGFYCGAEGLWTWQENGGGDSLLAGGSFWQANVFAGYRFCRRQADLRLALLNLAGQDYQLNPLNLMAELPRQRTLTVSLGFSF